MKVGTTGKTLLQQAALYGLFTIVRRGLNVALTPLYTHYLTPTDYGVLEILNLCSWLVTIIGACKVDAAFYRYYVHENSPEARARVLGSSVLLTLGISAVIVLGGLAALPAFTSYVSQERHIPALDMYLIGAATWLDLATLVPVAYCRVTDRVGWAGAVAITQALVSCTLSIIGVIGLGAGYRAILVGNLAAATCAVVLCVVVLSRAQIRFTLVASRSLLAYGLPMFPGTLFMYVIGSADRLFLARFTSLGDVGVYGVAAKFALAVNLIVMGPFGEMWAANQYRLYASQDVPLYQHTALTYLAVLFLFVLGVEYFSYDFVVLFLGSAYQGATHIIPLLVFAVAIWGIVPTLDLGSLVVPGKTWIRSVATGSGAVANVLANLFLVRKFGAQGAAIASVIGFITLAVVTGVLCVPLVRMRVPMRRVLAMTVALTLASTLALVGDALPYAIYVGVRLVMLAALGGLFYVLAWRAGGLSSSRGLRRTTAAALNVVE